MYTYPAQKPKFVKNSRKTNQKGHKKSRVPKDKIIYVADILRSAIKTPIMVPGLWMLPTHDGCSGKNVEITLLIKLTRKVRVIITLLLFPKKKGKKYEQKPKNF